MPRTVAFFSYARSDDENTWGLLTKIHQVLQEIINLKTGDQVEVFLDREQIFSDDNWEATIEAHLERAHFLIPILTPTYLSRPSCRKELEYFLDRGLSEKRSPRILPITLVETQRNEAAARRISDRLAQEVSKLQHFDWTQHQLDRSDRLSQALINDINALAERIASILDDITQADLSGFLDTTEPDKIENNVEKLSHPQRINRVEEEPSKLDGQENSDLVRYSPRIFLAHAREDKQQVRALYYQLRRNGFNPWLDEIDLVPGQIWKDEIPKAIADAGVFLACLSQQSVGKVGYVQNEFRRALTIFGERPPGSIFLIPVRLDECEVPDLRVSDLGFGLKDIHWVDLFEVNGIDRLISAVQTALAEA